MHWIALFFTDGIFVAFVVCFLVPNQEVGGVSPGFVILFYFSRTHSFHHLLSYFFIIQISKVSSLIFHHLPLPQKLCLAHVPYTFRLLPFDLPFVSVMSARSQTSISLLGWDSLFLGWFHLHGFHWPHLFSAQFNLILFSALSTIFHSAYLRYLVH